jgi:hypothetical protein
MAVRTEPSFADPATAVEHAGEASARAGNPGTVAPVALVPGGGVADEPARLAMQPAQTTAPTATSASPPREARARNIAAETPIP